MESFISDHFAIPKEMPGWPEVENEPAAIAAFTTVPLTFPSADFPRLDEPSMVELRDGSMLFAYANHDGRTDNDSSDIVGVKLDRAANIISSEKVIMPAPVDGLNSMSPALRRLPDGRIGMVFSYRVSTKTASRRFSYSDDEGATWSEPVLVAGEDIDGGYKTGCHDRFTIHSSGRFIAPCHCSDDWDKHYLHVRVARSDDAGQSWNLGESIELPRVVWEDGRKRIESGCVEPCAVERSDGSLLMTMRTAMGTQFKSESFDRGETWSNPVSMEVRSPTAPCHISRIPGGDDLLIVWSPRVHTREPLMGRRTALMTGVSSDGGRSWPSDGRRVLVSDPVGTVSYPTVNYVDNDAWITFRATSGDSMTEGGLTATALIRASITWLRGENEQ
jgi:sialidase-1